MFKRLYIHNFRCLQNLELPIGDKPSALLIGKNGSGKSTISHALALLAGMARGTNRVGQLVKPGDFTHGRTDEPMRFEVDVELAGRLYQYRLTLELPPGFKELRVQTEQLSLDGQPIYTREHAQVTLNKASRSAPAAFLVDWHLIALPIIQEQSETDPLFLFKRWLSRSFILAPIPSLITEESSGETLWPERDARNLGAWFAGLIGHSPRVYTTIDGYLRTVWPDFWDLQNPLVGGETRSLKVQFREAPRSLSLPIGSLSDGEKCFLLCALVLAANEAYGPVFCFWDEPDSHLAIDEVGHFVAALRRSFESGGQVLMTSHNAETIRRFSDENTLVLYRRSHLEPTRVKSLEEIGVKGDLVEALLRGDVET
ncbi:ATP-binding protein [Polyangium sp. 15x6]|uniref:AAA family ATPase n=1 Tax=Polyangium sp. 15x6 TaxID=3042687 RepID=UPI00249A2C54|nr:ATP-binding protein [Polyangium sp. 15x6]MDI3287948.1 AAA family ATPase [Polyangium sp. 15x6]